MGLKAFALMERYGVTHTFLPPTALKMAMQVERPSARFDLRATLAQEVPVGSASACNSGYAHGNGF